MLFNIYIIREECVKKIDIHCNVFIRLSMQNI